ncbi:MAG: PKD-like domain-containing protein [bacterium]
MLALALVLSGNPARGQTQSNCPNSDFDLGDFTNWQGYYGTFWNPAQDTGFVTFPPPFERHLIIPAPGYYDPNTGDLLLTVYPGEEFSARLGNDNNGAEGEELVYDITVSSQSYLFMYRYAVVLEDPSHIPANQPSFTIEIRDSVGTVLDSTCGYYYVYAQPGLPGWNTHTPHTGNPVHWRDWTTVGMNLTPYTGQTVSVVFITRDCSQGGHYGYAYLSAYCSALQMQVSLCQDDTVAILTAPPGFTYLWSTGDSSNTIMIPNPVTGTVYYCIITSYNGCQDTIYQTLSYTIVDAGFTVIPACASHPCTFTDTSTVSQNAIVSRKWFFDDGSLPVITPNATITHTFSTPGSYHVKLEAYSTEGCMDSVRKTVVIDSLPHLTNNPLMTQICDSANTNITLTSDVTGTQFTWTAASTSPYLAGYANQTTPTTFLSQTLTNSGSSIDSVTYTILPINGTCTGDDTVYFVRVVPEPDLTNPILIKSICDSTSTDLVLTSSQDSTVFTWTCTQTSGNISGWSANPGPGTTSIDQILGLSVYVPDSVIYHITPQANGCLGSVYNYKVIVNPIPLVTVQPMFASICSEETTNIQLTATCEGTTFTWTSAQGVGNVTGNTGGNTDLITDQLFNLLNTAGSILYTITPATSSCTGNDTVFTMWVKPLPHLTNQPKGDSICNNTGPNVTLTSDVTNTWFTWTATGSSPLVTGFSDNPVPTTLLNQTLTNSGYVYEWATYQITPTAAGCDGPDSSYVVTVYPVPDLSNNPPDTAICSGQSTGVTLTSHVAGTLFTWTATGSSLQVSGYSDNAIPTTTLNQTLTNSGNAIEWVTYQVASTANGCPGTPNQVVVTVNPLPVASFAVCFDTLTTTQAQPFTLKGAVPPGGTFTGAGVTGSVFYPALAGAGVHHIRYTYTNNFGCLDSAFLTIHITNPTSHICGDSVTDIRDNRKYPTVSIGSQCWMAANLNFGSSIAASQLQRDNCINEKYCFNDNPVNCTSFGGLYQWDEVMQYAEITGLQGFCPPGWHIPTETDWNILFSVYISNGFAGNAVKSSGYSGFNAFLSGIRFHTNVWRYPINDPVLRSILYWSSTLRGTTKAWAHGMNEVAADIEYTPSVSFYPALRSNGFAVRCLKD